MSMNHVPAGEAHQQLERILASPAFARSRRLSQFLRFTVELAVSGRSEEIKEHRIGAEVFDRGPGFDPQADTIVRTQAHRLRAALSAYYENEGRLDPLVIEFSKGSYVPNIRENSPAPRRPRDGSALQHARLWRLAAGSLALVAAFVMGTLWKRWFAVEPPPGSPLAHVSLPLFAQGILNVGMGPVVVSPRGTAIVFPLIENSGTRRLWLRSLRSMNATGLAGTEEGYYPFWSPNEAEIGFFANGMLKVFRLSDGSVRDLCEAPLGRGGSWNRDGVILFTPRAAAGPIYRTSATGGTPVAVTSLDRSRAESGHRWPEFLSDGRHFVYASHSRLQSNEGIFLATLEGGAPVRLEPALSQARHARTRDGEFLLYVKDKALQARRLNLPGGQLHGPEVTVANGLYYSPAAGSSFSVAGDQYLVYQSARNQETAPVLLDRTGRVIRNLAAKGNYEALVLSHDGRRLAAEISPTEQDESDIWTALAEKPAFLRMTLDGGAQSVWGREARSLTFVTPGDSFFTLWNKSLIEGEKQVLVWKSQYAMFPTDISADGRFLALHMNNPETQMDLWLLPLDPDTGRMAGNAIPVRRSRFNEGHGFFSPDGRHIAYFSDESGQQDVYVETLPPGEAGRGRRWKVSARGGIHPRWRGDGRELFYLSLDRSLMSIAVTNLGTGLEFGSPRKLFTPPPNSAGGRRSPYAVAPDGNSFYFLISPAGSGLSHVSLLTGWASLLTQSSQ